MAAPGERTTTVAGRRIAWASAGEGPPVLLVHGFASDRSSFLLTVPALRHAARLVAIDLPGHGASDMDVGDGSVPFLAGIVRSFMAAESLVRPHVVAHSLGAAIALEIATSEPDAFSGLSLIAPAGLGGAISRDFTEGYLSMRDEAAARATLALLVAKPSMIGRQMVRDALAFATRPDAAAALATIARANFPDGTQRHRYDERLGEIAAPWRLIWGGADRILPPPAPDAAPLGDRLAVIPEAGHMPHMERAAAVNPLLLADIAASVG